MAWDDGAGSAAGCWSERMDPPPRPGIDRLYERPSWGPRNEEDIIMDNYFPETRTTDQQVKDAVYCWVLVNHPEVIEDARELVAA